MSTLTPYLNFAGQTEEAMTFYATVFGAEQLPVARFGDFGEAMGPLSEEEKILVANTGIMFPSGQMIMASDVSPSRAGMLRAGNSISLHLELDSPDEVRRAHAALAQGGSTEMEPAPTEWAELFCDAKDKFGVMWMLSYTGDARFVPAAAG
ncbi:MAG: VOC family protein [Candidatus Nanopelagicales bacterium]